MIITKNIEKLEKQANEALQTLYLLRDNIRSHETIAKSSETMAGLVKAQFNVLTDIQALLGLNTAYKEGVPGPHYAHDDAIATVNGLPEDPSECGTKFTAWVCIRNTGAIVWRKRTLKFIREFAKQPVVSTNRQPIQTLLPGETAKIPVVIDGHGFEGNFVLTCRVLDENDQDCFPNKPSLIKIPITIMSDLTPVQPI